MCRKLVLILWSLAAIALGSMVWGSDYYIDPNGSDATGIGSSSSPWYSLSYACSQATAPGDVIHALCCYNNNKFKLLLGQNFALARQPFIYSFLIRG